MSFGRVDSVQQGIPTGQPLTHVLRTGGLRPARYTHRAPLDTCPSDGRTPSSKVYPQGTPWPVARGNKIGKPCLPHLFPSYIQHIYNFCSSSDRMYRAISEMSQSSILHKSLIVTVLKGRFFLSLSNVEPDIWCLWIKVYVVSSEFCSVSQKGL